MKTEKDIRIRIAQIKQDNEHLLSGSLATVDINAPRALMQVSVRSMLEILYWVIEQKFDHQFKGKPNT